MIRYLQRLKAKKGFTVIELIVVIAIIGVLTAVIVSNAGTDREKKQSAYNAAQDFYSTVQYSFTIYMKYESDLSLAIKNETASINSSDKIIKYHSKLNGNYPQNKMTFIKMFIDKNQIKYVQTFTALKDMLSENTTVCRNKFDELLLNDFGTLMESNVDGYYYALVTFEGAGADPTQAPVKVHSAYYSPNPFTEVNGATDGVDYRINNLKFESWCRLSNGYICGVCSSAKYDEDGDSATPTVYIGNNDTYFMGADNALNATLGN